MSEKSKTGIAVKDGDKSVQLIQEVTPAPLLPSPEQLERYEQILPGTAERMLTMAEKQQDHAIEKTNETEKRNHSLAILGQWMVAFLCVCFVGVAVAGLFFNAPQTAYFAAAGAIAVVALSAIARKK